MTDKPFFIYDTVGDWHATKIGQFLFDTRGEYIGFLEEADVYKRDGEWVGRLTRDGRLIRKRTEQRHGLYKNIPIPPVKPANLPARAPLPSMPSELTYDTVDVLEEEPDIFKRISDLREDMD